jgi:hypothetical protein
MASRIDECIRCSDQATAGLARECPDSCFYFRFIVDRGCRKLDRD